MFKFNSYFWNEIGGCLWLDFCLCRSSANTLLLLLFDIEINVGIKYTRQIVDRCT